MFADNHGTENAISPTLLNTVKPRVVVFNNGPATVIGTAPISFVFAGLGAGLGELFDQGVAPDMGMFERPEILIPLAGLAVLSLAPLGWRLSRSRRRPR